MKIPDERIAELQRKCDMQLSSGIHGPEKAWAGEMSELLAERKEREGEIKRVYEQIVDSGEYAQRLRVHANTAESANVALREENERLEGQIETLHDNYRQRENDLNAFNDRHRLFTEQAEARAESLEKKLEGVRGESVEAKRILILMEHENLRAQREMESGGWLCDHTQVLHELDCELRAILDGKGE